MASESKKKLTRILSIDGGGIMGILPGQVLVALERYLQEESGDANKRIADYFDLVAGTSTGGILACAMLCPDQTDPTRPRHTAQQAVDIYMERGDEIFDVPWAKKIMSANGLSDEKYPAEALEEALDDNLGETFLSDLLKPCLITAYDVRRRAPHFFRSAHARRANGQVNMAEDFRLKEVARATSAAPTYFEAVRVKSRSDVPYPLIDGGVFANNPAMCAYAEARATDFAQVTMKGVAPNTCPTAKEMAILSIGTGKEREPYYYKDVKDWGLIGWVKPLIDILMSGNADTVDIQLTEIFKTTPKNSQATYLRIDPGLGMANNKMDDASVENLKALAAAGTETAEQHADELRKFAKLLVDNG